MAGRRAGRLSWLLSGLLVTTGCSPSAQFSRAEVVPIRKGGEPESLEFRADFSVRNADFVQVIYEAMLLGEGGRPLRAPGNQYRNSEGAISAGRTAFVPRSSVKVDDIRVQLPVEKLGVEVAGAVRGARFRVMDPSGAVLASVDRPVRLRWSDVATADAAAAYASADRPAAADSPRGEPSQPSASRRSPSEDTSVQSRTAVQAALREREIERERQRREAEQARSAEQPVVWAEDSRRGGRSSASGESGESRAAAVEAGEPAPSEPVAGSFEERPVPSHGEDSATFEYVVRRGDSLSRLAERFLGDGNRWRDIYELNRSQLYSAHVLPVGTTLRIPRRP